MFIKKTALVPQKQTGAMWRLWRQEHQSTGPLQVIQDAETQLLTAIPLFMEYRHAEYQTNVLLMLYGATTAAVLKHGQPPKQLYISPVLLPILKIQYPSIFQYGYNGLYPYFHCGELQFIDIYPESHLPSLLKLALDSIPRDTVIAVL